MRRVGVCQFPKPSTLLSVVLSGTSLTAIKIFWRSAFSAVNEPMLRSTEMVTANGELLFEHAKSSQLGTKSTRNGGRNFQVNKFGNTLIELFQPSVLRFVEVTQVNL